jgi:hypothetical protein
MMDKKNCGISFEFLLSLLSFLKISPISFKNNLDFIEKNCGNLKYVMFILLLFITEKLINLLFVFRKFVDKKTKKALEKLFGNRMVETSTKTIRRRDIGGYIFIELILFC